MKITNVSCGQFAGIQKRDISFTEGINVIYGKNESGKSTLVNLISRVLFQKAKLDRRRDKEFFERYFPGEQKGSVPVGDFVDGTVTMETENGTYTLSKVWGTDACCTLTTPGGMIRNQDTVEEILRAVLVYGEGVYADLLLSSQRNTDASLQTILDATRRTDAKQELADAVSRAFAQSDGISVDAIEEAIQAQIDGIAGKHWDFDREAPVRKAGRWSVGLGEILKAYYALEDARNAMKEISDLEQAADRAANDYMQADAAAQAAEEAYNRFNGFASRLTVQSDRKKMIRRIEEDLQKIRAVLRDWPQYTEKLEQARKLQTEQADRKVLDIWNGVQALQAEITEQDEQTASLPQPTLAEFSAVRKAQREITGLENKLCGMNLNAALQMLGGHSLQITSLRTGEQVDVSGGAAAITEAVKLEIPGVMVMELTPADVDVSSIRGQIDERRQIIEEIFAKYQVETLEALEAYAQKIEAAKAKLENVRNRISKVLGSCSMEELTQCCRQVGTVERSAEQIEREISALCGSVNIANYITRMETVIDSYVREYGSIGELKAKAFDLEEDRRRASESLSDEEDLPAEYRGITDPEAHLQRLRAQWKEKQNLRESAMREKASTAASLNHHKESNPDACPETVEKARLAFEETKSLLGHWRHIQAVFQAQRDGMDNNPMQELADRFARYLDVITGGTVSSEFPEGDKLNMIVYSGNTVLDYDKLSEGTKETVSLAFRLAVLDHLFPEGGGVIVFDDPFTDMDRERADRSCRLLKECALRHQVIFLTCREEYLAALEGNCIRVQA